MRRALGRPPPDAVAASRGALLAHVAVLAILVAVIWLREVHTKPKVLETATPGTSVAVVDAAMSR